MSALLGVGCPECGRVFPGDRLQTICLACGSPLLARYDTESLRKRLDRDRLPGVSAGIWRWEELLPVQDPAARISLGEGGTPLLHIERLGADLGLRALFIKDEGVNPTGTFKARGMAVAVSRAAELGVRELVVASAGNAGGAAAAYAARGGLKAHIFMPRDAPAVHAAEINSTGGTLHTVDGLLDDAGREAAREREAYGWFDLSTFKEPYRVEGKKTMGFELAEAFGWDLPDVIIYPTGGGTGLVGMWKAFGELEALGWIEKKRPRMVAVQPKGCAPLVRAWRKGSDQVERWEGAETAAQGLRVPKPFAGRLMLRALKESQGRAVTVSEEGMVRAKADLAQQEGVLVCLEGAATLAAARDLRSEGWLRPEERVVLFNTGMGLKGL